NSDSCTSNQVPWCAARTTRTRPPTRTIGRPRDNRKSFPELPTPLRQLLSELAEEIIREFFSCRFDEPRADRGNQTAHLNIGVASDRGSIGRLCQRDRGRAANEAGRAPPFESERQPLGRLLVPDCSAAVVRALQTGDAEFQACRVRVWTGRRQLLAAGDAAAKDLGI